MCVDSPVTIPTTEENPAPRNKVINTPEYAPPSEFSSPEGSKEEEKAPSIMSHAAIEIKTVDKLNHQTVSLISSERDFWA